MTPTDAADLIRRLVPGPRPVDVRPLGEGMDSRAYDVGGWYVVKLPKHAEASARVEREAAVLPELAGRLPLAVPRVEPLGRFGPDGFLAVGYPRVPGVPLDRARYEGLREPDREASLEALAGFLDALHAFPADRARQLGLPPHDAREDALAFLERVRTTLRPWLEPWAVERLEDVYGGFLGELSQPQTAPVLLHADFSPDHILFDPSTNRPCGVIDFGDVALGDPDFDLMYLDQDLGRDAVDAWLRRRPHPDPAGLYRKLHFFAVQNALDDLMTGLDRREDSVRDESRALVHALVGPPGPG